MRHDTADASSELRSSPVVPEHGGHGLVSQGRFRMKPPVLFKFNLVRIDRGDRLECLASSTFCVNHAMALKLYVKIFDLFQMYGVNSGNG
jgi:hypothetical protein